MKLKDEKLWNEYIKMNTGYFASGIMKIAKIVMQMLDEDPTPLTHGYYPNIHTPHGLIMEANKKANIDIITGAQGEYILIMVIQCHKRGEELRIASNGEKYKGEGLVSRVSGTISK